MNNGNRRDTDNSLSDYQVAYRTTHNILSYRPQSRASFDFNRASGAFSSLDAYSKGQAVPSEISKMYFTKALFPKTPDQLSEHEVERLFAEYGDSLYDISLIDQNLQKWVMNAPEQEHILATGGACAMEAVDVRNIRAMRAEPNGEELIPYYVKKAFSVFPTWTHISGSIIPTKNINILYDETFPWHLKIAEYGVDDADSKTGKVYEKIHDAVSRFVKLHNDDSTLVSLPFTDLELESKDRLHEWFGMYEKYIREIEQSYGIDSLEYNPDDFVRSWVMYTYMGPHILEEVRNVLKKEYDLENYSIHVRGKQLDHLTTERYSTWQHGLILNSAISKVEERKLKHLLSSKFHRHELAAYMWARDHLAATPSIGFAGFLDTNCYGDLLHETDIKKPLLRSKEDIDAYFASPLRLHTKNTESVYDFLRLFRKPTSIQFPKRLLDSIAVAKHSIEKYDKQIATIRKHINGFFLLQKINIELSKQNNVEVIEMLINDDEFKEPKDVLTSLYAFMNRYQKFNDINNVITKEQEQFSDLKNTSAFVIFQHLFKQISMEKQPKNKVMLQITFDPRICVFHDVFTAIITDLEEAIMEENQNVDDIIHEKQKLLDVYRNQLQHVSDEIIESWEHPLRQEVKILPLCDNMFVSYMQQLLFIPSVRAAYIEMNTIAERSDLDVYQKEDLICNAINSIFTVVVSSIDYVLRKKKQYPSYERYEFSYSSVLK